MTSRAAEVGIVLEVVGGESKRLRSDTGLALELARAAAEVGIVSLAGVAYLSVAAGTGATARGGGGGVGRANAGGGVGVVGAWIWLLAFESSAPDSFASLEYCSSSDRGSPRDRVLCALSFLLSGINTLGGSPAGARSLAGIIEVDSTAAGRMSSEADDVG